MRVVTLLMLLITAACAQAPAPPPPPHAPHGQPRAAPALSAEAACPVMTSWVRHLVELNISEQTLISYFHRDIETGEWMENFSVSLLPSLRLNPGERIRTGVIAGAEGSVLTVRWLSRPGSDAIVFPTPEALGTFLGRIVGPRGDPRRELSATVVVAYERRCDGTPPGR